MQTPDLARQLWARAWPHHRWLLLGLWALTQAAFLLKAHGPRFANDSARYLEYAGMLARYGHYHFTDPTDTFVYEHGQRYLAYIWFQAFWLKLGTGWWGIALGQIAVSGGAAAALYDAVRRLAGSAGSVTGANLTAPALATALFVLWPDVQQFNAYLLTESLFTSLSVLSFWALVRAHDGGWPAWLLLLGLLLLTALARPNGFVVGGAAVLAGWAGLWQRGGRARRAAWAAVGAAVLAAPLLLWALDQQLKTFFIVETYARGELMFGTQVWALHPTSPLILPPPGMGQVSRVAWFAAHNPGFLLRLMGGKLLVFFSSVKPYYSLSHRLLSVLVLWPLYALAGRAAFRGWPAWLPARVFLLAVPLLQAAVVTLTVDDWDVRFLAPVLPFVFALASLSMSDWVNE